MQQFIDLSVSNVALNRFEPTKFLLKLREFPRIPDYLQEEELNRIARLIIKAIPVRNYDSNNLQLRYNHMLAL